jgi:autotransporter translocation and assembly factor TamB
LSDFERARGPASSEGRGSFAFAGDRAFKVDAASRQFDPSRIGDFPAGNLIGTINASGALVPTWRVDGSVVIAQGSRLAGVSLQGTARGSVARDTIRDAVVDLKVGSAKISARGSTGRSDDRVVIDIDAPRLDELRRCFLPMRGLPPPGLRAATRNCAGFYRKRRSMRNSRPPRSNCHRCSARKP